MSEPRIPPRPAADWDDAVRDVLSVLRPPATARSARAKQPDKPQGARPASNILGIFVWHPDLAKAFFTFNNHLFHSTLTARDRELVTVRVSWLRRGEYEWSQHVRMARAAGVSDAEIEATSEGPDAKIWSERDATLLRAVDELVNDRYVADETWQQLTEFLDRQQVMDLVFTAGAYDLLAMAMNTFGLRLDPGQLGFPASEQTEITSRRQPRVDRDLCMGSGQCVYYAPNTFDQDGDGIATVTNPHGDSQETIEAAIAACPTGALSWADPEES